MPNEKWIAHDANYDLHYVIKEPLSITQLADEARSGRKFRATMERDTMIEYHEVAP